MTDPKKKVEEGRPAIVFHADEHGFAGLVKQDDGRAELLTGKFVRDGEPIPPGDGLYQLKLDREHGRHTVETIYEPPQAKTSKGPAKANSRAFRTGYEAIFGRTRREEELLN